MVSKRRCQNQGDGDAEVVVVFVVGLMVGLVLKEIFRWNVEGWKDQESISWDMSPFGPQKLGKVGMYRNHSLNTAVDRSRVWGRYTQPQSTAQEELHAWDDNHTASITDSTTQITKSYYFKKINWCVQYACDNTIQRAHIYSEHSSTITISRANQGPGIVHSVRPNISIHSSIQRPLSSSPVLGHCGLDALKLESLQYGHVYILGGGSDHTLLPDLTYTCL